MTMLTVEVLGRIFGVTDEVTGKVSVFTVAGVDVKVGGGGAAAFLGREETVFLLVVFGVDSRALSKGLPWTSSSSSPKGLAPD